VKTIQLFLSFSFLLVGVGRALSAPATPDEMMISRPVFTEDRQFTVETNVPAIRLDRKDMPFSVYVVKSATSRCALTQSEIRQSLLEIVKPESLLWSSLDSLLVDSASFVRKLRVNILIDDFSEYGGAVPIFGSYYFRSRTPLIALDCSGGRRQYWVSSLAHELVHAAFDGRNVDSWWEEAIAQMVENSAHGPQPVLTLKTLASPSDLPPLFDQRRPLGSRQSYALSYLFARYLEQQAGGWRVLRAMSGFDPENASMCETGAGFFFKAACLGRQKAEALLSESSLSTADAPMLAPEKITVQGLLRFFYVALAMNDPATPHYSVSGWKGLKLSRLQSTPGKLEAGQAQILNPDTPLAQIPAGYEVYRIQSDRKGNFRILPRDEMQDAELSRSPFVPVLDVILVMNLEM
jgi:hypothetical protein